MSLLRIIAIFLIVVGIVGLVYGKLPYTKTTTDSNGTLLTQTTKETIEQKTVNVPLWMSVAAIVAGGLLFFVPKRG